MDAFVSRKRRRIEPREETPHDIQDEESTDYKLAVLASLHPTIHQATLLEALLASDGIVERASEILTPARAISPRKRPFPTIGHQASLSSYGLSPVQGSGPARKPLVKKGKTLFLYSAGIMMFVCVRDARSH